MPSPPLFAELDDDITMAPTQHQQNQKPNEQEQRHPKRSKLEVPPLTPLLPPATAEVVAVVAAAAADAAGEEEQQDQFAQHYASILQTALEAQVRLHGRLDEVLNEGRYALKTALREMEGAVAEAKQLVNAQLQRSLDAAKREETLVRGSALKAEALSRKLAFIRVRVEGGAEEGDNCGDDGG